MGGFFSTVNYNYYYNSQKTLRSGIAISTQTSPEKSLNGYIQTTLNFKPEVVQDVEMENGIKGPVFCTSTKPSVNSVEYKVHGVTSFPLLQIGKRFSNINMREIPYGTIYYPNYSETAIETWPDCLKKIFNYNSDIKEKSFIKIANDIREWYPEDFELIHMANFLTSWSGKCLKITRSVRS